MEKQDKTSEKELNKMKIKNLPNEKFKILVLKMFPELGRRIDKHSEAFNKKK